MNSRLRLARSAWKPPAACTQQASVTARIASSSTLLALLLVVLLSGCNPLQRSGSPLQVNRDLDEQSILATAVQAAMETALATNQAETANTALPATSTSLLLPTLSPPPATQTHTLPPPTEVPPTSTPDPYEGLTIDSLLGRDYGGGELQVWQVLGEDPLFTRYLVSYPSDGLEIYGFMNVPKPATSPLPVVIALHGYIEPGRYNTLDYTTGYADTLARAGFLVLHPNLRGYTPSDDGPNMFRVGMAVDVLNLVALVKEWGGRPGPLEPADPQAIGLWGHSMGGGIATRVITVSSDVRATVLYGAMSGDERQNYEAIYGWSNGQRGLEELNVAEQDLKRISPVFYLDRVKASLSIHHGENDETVPVGWSQETCRRLQELEMAVECFSYPGQPHTFYGDGAVLFMQRVIEFFNKELK